MVLDLVVVGGTVIDGTGGPRRRADVGMADGRIVAIGDLSAVVADRGVECVDVDGLIVAPGFVDLHSHSDLTLLSDGRARSKVSQGVTTEINGNCGMGGVPLPPAVAKITRAANATIDPDPGVRWDWTDLAGYVAALGRADVETRRCVHAATRLSDLAEHESQADSISLGLVLPAPAAVPKR